MSSTSSVASSSRRSHSRSKEKKKRKSKARSNSIERRQDKKSTHSLVKKKKHEKRSSDDRRSRKKESPSKGDFSEKADEYFGNTVQEIDDGSIHLWQNSTKQSKSSFFAQLIAEEASKDPLGTFHAEAKTVFTTSKTLKNPQKTDKWECPKCGKEQNKNNVTCESCGGLKRLSTWR